MKEHLKPIPGETPEARRKRIRKGTLYKVGAAFPAEMFEELEQLRLKRHLMSVPELIRVTMSEAVFAARRDNIIPPRQQPQVTTPSPPPPPTPESVTV
jgi:hypothetical protein